MRFGSSPGFKKGLHIQGAIFPHPQRRKALVPFFHWLSQIYEDEQNKPMPAISDETILYWRDAASHPPSWQK
jgi:hypothetical protein